MSSNCNYIQRKITPKGLDVHPVDNALIIHCEAEVSILDNEDSKSNSFFETTKTFDKIICLKSFDHNTDINTLCQDVIIQSKNLISFNQKDEVIKLLNYLKNRKSVPTKTVMGTDIEMFRPKTTSSLIQNSNSNSSLFNFTLQNSNKLSKLSNSTSNQMFTNSLDVFDYQKLFNQIELNFRKDDLIGKYFNDNEKVNITRINEYIELLYEDGLDKLKGAVMIFRLTLENENLLSLTTDETLFCAMSRILREEGRKNYNLCCVILAFFCSISFFKEFHLILAKYKVGAFSFDLINYIFEKEANFLQTTKSNSARNTKNIKNNDNVFNENYFSAEEESEHFDANSQKNLINKKKLDLLQKKNNRLLQLLFTILLNLSNDTLKEIKMINKNILILILNCLKRQNLSLELQITLVTFLQRLSVKWEIKNQLIFYNIVPILYNLLNNIVNQILFYNILTNIVLKVIFNLTFDQKCRNLMIKHKFISKLVQILIKENFKNEKLIILIFYQFTLEKKYCDSFIITLSGGKNLINLFMNRILQTEQKINKNELIHKISLDSNCCFYEYVCLLINLAMNKNCAQVICENGALEKLFDKAIPIDLKEENCIYINIFYMKLIHNLSLHDHPYKMIFLEHIDFLIKLIINFSNIKSDNTNQIKVDNFNTIFVINALKILSNLQKVDWLNLIKKYSLYNWIRKRIKIGEQFEDEIVLSCLSLLGSSCTQEECAIFLIEKDYIKALIDFFIEKQEDDEIIIQIIYIINIMCRHDVVCEYLVKNDQISIYLFDLLNDANSELKSICNCTLDLLAEKNQDLHYKLKEERFKLFNKSWLEMINSNNDLSKIKSDILDYNYLNEDLNFLDEDSLNSLENSLLLKQKIFSFENLKESSLDLESSSFEESLHKQELDEQKIKNVITSIIPDENLSSKSTKLRSHRPHTAYKTRTKSANLNLK